MSEIAKDLKPLIQPISKLKPAKHNPRKGDVESIKKSYERFGQRKPIVANRATGEIIAGNHQFLAAKELGWTELAVVFVDDDPETAIAYGVADNRIGQLGEWDIEELVFALDEIGLESMDTVGFKESDLEDFRALLDEQQMTAPAIAIQDGGLRSADGGTTPIDSDTKVKKEATYQEFLERYANRAVRAIILYYSNDDYATMVENLKQAANKLGTKDNAETVQALIEKELKNEQPT
jgi:ParB-like chromosome segregation protein Spo0J